MPSKDFDRMIQLGEWIERFLNPEIKTWDFRKLIQDGMEIANADLVIDYSKTCISEIEKIPNTEGCKLDFSFFAKHFKNSLAEFEERLDESMLSEEAYANVKNMAELDKLYNDDIWIINEKMDIDVTYLFKHDILEMMKIREEIEPILIEISKSKEPWDVLLARLQTEEEELRQKNKDTIPRIGRFICEYSGLTEGFIVRDNRLVKTRTFGTEVHYNYMGETFHGFYEIHFSSLFSNIVLDFLLLGGQDYFLFCEYCGRFTVIRRKGRKKYCSDICRTSHGREKKAE